MVELKELQEFLLVTLMKGRKEGHWPDREGVLVVSPMVYRYRERAEVQQ